MTDSQSNSLEDLLSSLTDQVETFDAAAASSSPPSPFIVAGRRQSAPEEERGSNRLGTSEDRRRPVRQYQRFRSTVDGRRRSEEEEGEVGASVELVQLLLQSGGEDSPGVGQQLGTLLADVSCLRDRLKMFTDAMDVVDEQFRTRMTSFVEV